MFYKEIGSSNWRSNKKETNFDQEKKNLFPMKITKNKFKSSALEDLYFMKYNNQLK